ncbi:PAS domain-containing protein [Bradyrhizobium sp. GCM10027634]|uniref:PAS domain-containing protein n=1 Tax=unclassified Bradyrhizobium TaxID=2631580 RepID=UPI00188BDB52|nr:MULTISPECIES: PAS domain-containing protein [unclassified Bradyrhizobium]MDN5003886.1 PAS domain-containing protein [Bradyrhizobium sp. WYCCWR 12677]
MLNNSEMMRLAKKMHGRYGHLAEQVMNQRATENRSAGDVEAADLWTRVAAFIRAIKTTNQHRELAKSFRPAFQVAPHPYLLVSPNLVIAGANDAYVAGTGARHSDLIGCELFDAFPDNPADPNANGVKNLKTSLTRVLDAGLPDVMERQRYDIPRRDGLFEERWWMVQNLPVFDDGGRLIFVLHHVQDVTASIKSTPL